LTFLLKLKLKVNQHLYYKTKTIKLKVNGITKTILVTSFQVAEYIALEKHSLYWSITGASEPTQVSMIVHNTLYSQLFMVHISLLKFADYGRYCATVAVWKNFPVKSPIHCFSSKFIALATHLIPIFLYARRSLSSLAPFFF